MYVCMVWYVCMVCMYDMYAYDRDFPILALNTIPSYSVIKLHNLHNCVESENLRVGELGMSRGAEGRGVGEERISWGWPFC